MFVWRISKHLELTGRGGMMVSGRWHTLPIPIVYSSDQAHTAYLERLHHVVHPSLLPAEDKLLKIGCPATATIEAVDGDTLDPLWKSDAVGWRICRPIGDEWIRSRRSTILKVPSAARKGAFNYLINPLADDAGAIGIVESFDQPFPDFVTRVDTSTKR